MEPTNTITYEKAEKKAKSLYEQNQERLIQIEYLKTNHLPYDEEEYRLVALDAMLQIDDITPLVLQMSVIKNSPDISDEEFRQTSKKIGITSEKAIQFIFEERESEYYSYYKIDKANPGLVFIIRQIILDEFEINRMRRDLTLLDTPFLKTNDKDETKKRLLDSIDRVNKRIYEFTKFLKAEREETLAKEAETKISQTNELELRIEDIKDNFQVNQIFSQAQMLQTQKEQEILEEDLEIDSHQN